MKYNLINNKTKEEHLCDKVTVDGFDYYTSNDFIEDGRENFFTYDTLNHKILHISHIKYFGNENNGRGDVQNGRASFKTFKGTSSGVSHPKVIATNNPHIDIPKIVSYDKIKADEEDMIDFLEWVEKEHWWKSTDTRFHLTVGLWTKAINGDFSDGKTTGQLLQLWKDQQVKTLYYE